MAERRFACTQCGQYCNRGPELEMGEAAQLSLSADTRQSRAQLHNQNAVAN